MEIIKLLQIKAPALGYFFWLLTLKICLFTAQNSYAETYTIDPEHSRLEFKVRHLGIGWVVGKFAEFGGNFTYDPKDLSKSSADVVIKASSLDSGTPKRDRHLRSPDFLNTMEQREIRFFAKQVEGTDPENFKVKGVLTIRDIQKEVYLDVVHGGSIIDPWGNPRSAFHATTKINRKDFGLKWNRIIETGALLVGEEIEISMDIQGIAVKDTRPKLEDPSAFKLEVK